MRGNFSTSALAGVTIVCLGAVSALAGQANKSNLRLAQGELSDPGSVRATDMTPTDTDIPEPPNSIKYPPTRPPEEVPPQSMGEQKGAAKMNRQPLEEEIAPEAGEAGEGCDCCDNCDCGRCGHHGCKIHECCPLECDEVEICRLFNCCCLDEHCTTLTGWLDFGIMFNGRDTTDRFNGPVTYPDRDEGQFNQFYLALERTAEADNCGWFIGGRVDLMYGSDYFFMTAAGLDGSPQGNVPRWRDDDFRYGSAMPQLYLETTYDDMKVKWGHFYTIIGYEVVPAKDNFFYTHSYAMQYGEPTTQTGILASRPYNDNWTWSAGLVGGWNTFNADQRGQFLGGLTYTDKEWGTLALAIVTGDDSTRNLPGVGDFANRTMYSVVWTRNFTSRFTYVLQHDLGVQEDAQIAADGPRHAEWYGLNQYLFYKIDCCWTAGMRFEWFRDDDGFVVTGLRPGNSIAGASFPGNFYETSVGLNYKPNGNLSIRPELRWDWYNGLQNQAMTPANLPYNDGQSDNQFLFGLDVIYQF